MKMNREPCMRKLVISACGLSCITAIIILQVLLKLLPEWTYIISTSLIYVLTFFMFGFRLFFSRRPTKSAAQRKSLQTEQDNTAVTINTNVETELTNTSLSSLPITIQEPPPRLYFLDNVKIFLTIFVVTHHVICAFGGCKQGNWYLIIGNYNNPFRDYCGMITTINQAYFMPLFFFVSAYLTPDSYRRKGKHAFMLDRTKRLWIPAMFVSFTLSPTSAIIGQLVSSSGVNYLPTPGPTWFLFWLLIFSWVYSTVKETSLYSSQQDDGFVVETASFSSEQEDDGSPNQPYPGMVKRWLSGILICGLGMYGFCFAVSGFPYFYTMPVGFGSFINNIFFFIVGIYASNNKWLSPSQLDDEVWPLLYITAFIEAVFLIGLTTLTDGMEGSSLMYLYIGFFMVAGVFCVDMSMVVLQFFCYYSANSLNTFGLFLSRNAYAVYLLHPIIITMLTAAFIRVYNYINGYDVIVFQDNTIESGSILLGPGKGSFHLFFGFLCVWGATQLICWPLAWILTKHTGLKNIL